MTDVIGTDGHLGNRDGGGRDGEERSRTGLSADALRRAVSDHLIY